MAVIVALVHGKSGAYGISFPDFPGCVCGGKTISEALQRAPGALLSHMDAMAAEGLAMPEIRELDELKSSADFREDFADAVLASAVSIDLPGKATRLNISLDERLVSRIDKRARELGESRSGFLAAAAKERLASV